MIQAILSSDCFFVIIITLCLALSIVVFVGKSSRTYAPGPWGFPVVGHLPLLGHVPTDTFKRWRNRYGDVFRIRFGSWNAVVLNGYATIKEALEEQGDTFSSRPEFLSTKIQKTEFDGEDSVDSGPFNVAYLKHRKMTASALRLITNSDDPLLQNIVYCETEKLIQALFSHKTEAFDPSEYIQRTIGSINYQILYGITKNVEKDGTMKEIVNSMNEFRAMDGLNYALDVLPWLKYIFRGKMAKFTELLRKMYIIVKHKVKKHQDSFVDSNLRGITDVFLSNNLPENVLNGQTDVSKTRLLNTLITLSAAGYETMSATVTWLILYMAAYPDVQKQVQREIDEIVGHERRVTFQDRSALNFTEATILEVMRVRSAVPLGLFHFTVDDTKLNGYDINKNTVAIINLQSVNFDESIWKNPAVFQPNRMLDDDGVIDVVQRNRIGSFGFGRRRCVGEVLARLEAFLIFSCLLQMCSFSRPQDQAFDLDPTVALVHFPKPFKVVVRKRV